MMISYLLEFRKTPDAVGLSSREIVRHGAKSWNALSDAQKRVGHSFFNLDLPDCTVLIGIL